MQDSCLYQEQNSGRNNSNQRQELIWTSEFGQKPRQRDNSNAEKSDTIRSCVEACALHAVLPLGLGLIKLLSPR